MMLICKNNVIKFVFENNVDTSRAPGDSGCLMVAGSGVDPANIIGDIQHSEAQIYTDLDVALPDGFALPDGSYALNHFKFVNGEIAPI